MPMTVNNKNLAKSTLINSVISSEGITFRIVNKILPQYSFTCVKVD